MTPSCFACGQTPSPSSAAKTKLNCPGCARNKIYKYRIEYAQLLLEKDSFSKQIDKVTRAQEAEQNGISAGFVIAERGASTSEQDEANLRWASKAASIKAGEARERTATLRRENDRLKSDIEAKRAKHAKRKDEITQRRSDLKTASYEQDERHHKSLSKLENEVKKIKTLWNRVHATMAESRYYLAQELAREIAMLKRHESRSRDGKVVYSYSISGIGIVNLRGLCGVEKDHVNASLNSIARLVCLVSNYLSLRLPAEICLPRPGNPLPSIVPPTYSYKFNHQGTKTRNPRSRPLSIAKAISRLAREDPVASTSFLEGVSLLAWDVAWLARTQGVRQGTESWEDICDIGHNLYRLFIAPPAQAPSVANLPPPAQSSSASPKSSRNLADPPSSRLQPRTTNNHSALGRYSHGSAQFFLCSAEGTEFMGNWKYNGPGRFVEKVKGALISEIHSAEWELLDGQDWSRDNEGEVERERKDSQAEPGENLEQTVLL